MGYNHDNSLEGISRAFRRLNVISALAMMVFVVASLTMLGLVGEIVELFEQHTFLPLGVSLAALVVIFMSSGTRDPTFYHPVEQGTILTGLIVMFGFGFSDAFVGFVEGYDPWGTVIVFGLFVIVSAILAR